MCIRIYIHICIYLYVLGIIIQLKATHSFCNYNFAFLFLMKLYSILSSILPSSSSIPFSLHPPSVSLFLFLSPSSASLSLSHSLYPFSFSLLTRDHRPSSFHSCDIPSFLFATSNDLDVYFFYLPFFSACLFSSFQRKYSSHRSLFYSHLV